MIGYRITDVDRRHAPFAALALEAMELSRNGDLPPAMRSAAQSLAMEAMIGQLLAGTMHRDAAQRGLEALRAGLEGFRAVVGLSAVPDGGSHRAGASYRPAVGMGPKNEQKETADGTNKMLGRTWQEPLRDMVDHALSSPVSAGLGVDEGAAGDNPLLGRSLAPDTPSSASSSAETGDLAARDHFLRRSDLDEPGFPVNRECWVRVDGRVRIYCSGDGSRFQVTDAEGGCRGAPFVTWDSAVRHATWWKGSIDYPAVEG